MNDTFEFSRDFQDLCLATILRHSKELGYALTCLQPIYFGGVEATLVAKAAGASLAVVFAPSLRMSGRRIGCNLARSDTKTSRMA